MSILNYVCGVFGVDNRKRHIREKLEKNPQNPRYLKVVWGQGYKVG